MSVVVVGAGLAGLRVCEGLRQHGYDDRITLIGGESAAPYTRPPLSKELLRGDVDAASVSLLDGAELAALDLDLRLGQAATSLSAADRSVTVGSDVVAADDIAIATGVTARQWPGLSSPHVLTLRSIEDCLHLQQFLAPGARVVVIGAGFIGLEVAASARHYECSVTVVDIVDEPLSRVLDPSIGVAVRELHSSHGVEFHLGVGVGEVLNDAVVLDTGVRLDCDVVVVGIGAVPATNWLADSGLTIDNGVVCGPDLLAAPHIWAVGDIARWPHPPHDEPVRIEHWTNAVEQAQHVALAIASGVRDPFEPVPYFWSDHYDAKLQSIGVSSGDETRVVVGSLDDPKWVAFVRRGDELAGIIGMRSAGAVMRRKPLLAARTSWADALATVS